MGNRGIVILIVIRFIVVAVISFHLLQCSVLARTKSIFSHAVSRVEGLSSHYGVCALGSLLANKWIVTARKSLEKGNVFTPVCHSFHGGGGVVGRLASQHASQVTRA